jgi:hypothetical protein
MNQEQETKAIVLDLLDELTSSVYESGAKEAKASIDFGHDGSSDDEYELVMIFRKKGSSE